VQAEVEGEQRLMRKGDVILIPAGTPHKFTNLSSEPCTTFNTYSPPEY
jgi:mannose-6-phosphate isomerase-like protein (cupin superfamily)